MNDLDSFTLDSDLLEESILTAGKIFIDLIDRMEQKEGKSFTLQFFMNYLQLILTHYFLGIEGVRNNTLPPHELKKTITTHFQELEQVLISRLTSIMTDSQYNNKTLH